jgi:hypothetical protein
MPLTPADDYLIHQTPETMDRVYTSDRNFYDRYFYGVYPIDGSMHMLFAFGQYPNIGVMDAFATIVVDNKTQYTVRASRILGSDRMDTQVGPIGVQITNPLRTSRIYAEDNEMGIKFDLTFEARTFPYEEPHFTRMSGPRRVMDYTRMTQHGRMSGTLTVAGETHTITPDTWWGVRDHSWGIRPVGGGEPPSAPTPDAGLAGFYWQWSPVQFDDVCFMYTNSEDGDGSRWHGASELLYPYDANREPESLAVVSHDLKLRPGTRVFDSGSYEVARPDGALVRIRMEPKQTLYMSGGGYSYLGGWRHGQYHGPLVVETESWDLTDPNVLPKLGAHAQTICDFHVEGLGDIGVGHGIFEFLSLGAYQPYGFKTFGDVSK